MSRGRTGLLARTMEFSACIFLKDQGRKVWEITNEQYYLPQVSTTFHGRDIFAPIAAHLSLGVSVHVLGKELEHYVHLEGLEPERNQDGIKARVICIDHFGNLVSNISRQLFTMVVGDKPFRIRVGGLAIHTISHTYADGRDGEVIALFGSSSQLEISRAERKLSKVLTG